MNHLTYFQAVLGCANFIMFALTGSLFSLFVGVMCVFFAFLSYNKV
jgi:hypothetical protein